MSDSILWCREGAHIAILGATGAVGREMIRCVDTLKLPVRKVDLLASARSAGKSLSTPWGSLTVHDAGHFDFRGVDIVLCSAGKSVSLALADRIVSAGALMIDNTSAFRRDPKWPLVVPEVNGHLIALKPGIIANPNCSTIQAVVALKPLYDKFGIKRIVYSTYQAVSGAGVAGYNDLKDGINGVAPKKFPQPIAYNMLPHIDVFMEDGYTKEEWKMIVETRKILHDQSLRVTATTVRVPVFYGHSESINVEFCKKCTRQDVVDALENFPGLVVMDDVKNNVYPTPLIAENHDEVFVGRIRLDDSVDSGANLWVVADNIRKGAATNAVQIVELLIKNALEA